VSSVSKAARIGICAVTLMARRRDAPVTAGAVASEFDVSEAHVAKVLQQLVRRRFVVGVRGIGGGYRLACDPSRVSMLDIVETIDGERTEPCDGCDLRHGRGPCPGHDLGCAVQAIFNEIGDTAYFTMKSVTISTLARPGRPPLRS